MNIQSSEITLNGINFIVKMLEGSEVDEFLELRYRVYVAEKNWEQPNVLGIEVDHFDKSAYHFGLYADGIKTGYVRLIDGRLVIPPIFEHILYAPERNCVEISRMIVRKGASIPVPVISAWMYKYVLNFYLLNKYASAYALMQTSHLGFLSHHWRDYLNFDRLAEETFFKTGCSFIPVKITPTQILLKEISSTMFEDNWTVVEE